MSRAPERALALFACLLALCAGSSATPAQQRPTLVILEIVDLGGCRGCAGSLTRALEKLDVVEGAALHDERPELWLTMSAAPPYPWVDLRRTVRDKGYTVGEIELVVDATLTEPLDRLVLSAPPSHAFPVDLVHGFRPGVGRYRATLGEGDATIVRIQLEEEE